MNMIHLGTYLGREVTFAEAGEILGMGGSWMGTMFWGNSFVTEGVMLDSLVVDEEWARLFFVKCYMPTRWRKDVFFRVCFIQRANETICEIKRDLSWIGQVRDVSEAEISVILPSPQARPSELVLCVAECECHSLGARSSQTKAV